jgi:hypothetical protein
LSENEKEKEKENDRFVPLAMIRRSPPSYWRRSDRFTSLRGAAVATTIYVKDSSLTLVTHSLYNNSSDHNHLSENKKNKDRFVPFATIC